MVKNFFSEKIVVIDYTESMISFREKRTQSERSIKDKLSITYWIDLLKKRRLEKNQSEPTPATVIKEEKPLVEKIDALLVERYKQVSKLLDSLGDWIPESELPKEEYLKFIKSIKQSKKILFLSHNDGDGITSVSIAINLAKALNPDIKIDFFPCPTGWSVKQWKSFLLKHIDIITSIDTISLLDLNDDSFFTAIRELAKENNFILPKLLRADHHNKRNDVAQHFVAHVVPKGKKEKQYVDSGSLLLRETYRQAVLKGDLKEIPFFIEMLSLIGLLADGKEKELAENNPFINWIKPFIFDLGGGLGTRPVRIVDDDLKNIISDFNSLLVSPIVPEQLLEHQSLLKNIISEICLDPKLADLDASQYKQIISRYSNNEFVVPIMDYRISVGKSVEMNIEEIHSLIHKNLIFKKGKSEFEDAYIDPKTNIKYTIKYKNAYGGKRLICKLDLSNQNKNIPILDAEEKIWKEIFYYVRDNVKDADLVDIHFHTIRPNEDDDIVIISRVGKLNDVSGYRAKEIIDFNPASGGHDIRGGMTLLLSKYKKLKKEVTTLFLGENIDLLNAVWFKYGPLKTYIVESYEELEQSVITRADAVLEFYQKK